jgi:hypothetical protein
MKNILKPNPKYQLLYFFGAVLPLATFLHVMQDHIGISALMVICIQLPCLIFQLYCLYCLIVNLSSYINPEK